MQFHIIGNNIINNNFNLKNMKRILLSFFAIIAIAMTANAEDFVGSVEYNMALGAHGTQEGVKFSVNNEKENLSFHCNATILGMPGFYQFTFIDGQYQPSVK